MPLFRGSFKGLVLFHTSWLLMLSFIDWIDVHDKSSITLFAFLTLLLLTETACPDPSLSSWLAVKMSVWKFVLFFLVLRTKTAYFFSHFSLPSTLFQRKSISVLCLALACRNSHWNIGSNNLLQRCSVLLLPQCQERALFGATLASTATKVRFLLSWPFWKCTRNHSTTSIIISNWPIILRPLHLYVHVGFWSGTFSSCYVCGRIFSNSRSTTHELNKCTWKKLLASTLAHTQ